MPTGIFDIHDRAEILTPQDIEAGKQLCITNKTHYIELPGQRPIPLTTFVERLNGRWERARKTFLQIEAMRAGYCTIEAAGAPPQSEATH
jgi:hypothetical protein